MKNSFNELRRLIDYVQPMYSNITSEWLQSSGTSINLRRAMIANVDIDGEIYKNIMDYVRFLNRQSADIALDLSNACNCKVSARVKAQNSIEYKIQNYKTGCHEFGRVSVNKCFNDLFGIRIILKDLLTYDEISSFIEDQYGNKYKCIDSSKLDYKATHLYFKENNQSFPWELQIWNSCDESNNLASHRLYKQGYTIWEEESKKGGIIND